MSGQNTLVTICEDGEALDPETNFQIQLYLNKSDGVLHGKVKGGNHASITIKAPDAIGETTSAAPLELLINSLIPSLPDRIKIPLNHTFFYSYFVVATRTGGSAPGVVGASGIAQLQFMVRNLAGVTTIVVTNGPTPLNTGDPEAAAWTADVTLGGVNGDELICTVTGEANKNISWSARIVQLAELDFN